ncbi:hypothetical protein BH11BAC5_BH11BAC5_34420 [soil metagenome]
MKKIFLVATVLLSFTIVFTACKNNSNKANTEQLAKDEMYICIIHNEVISNIPANVQNVG